mgnify:CR=1 FL=1
MKRVVIIADCIDTQNAGIQAYTRNMIDALSMLPDIELFCVRIKSPNNDILKNQIVVKPVLPFLIKEPFRLFFKLPSVIRKLKPDIVIEPAHMGPFNLPAYIKRVTVIHDLTPIKFPQWHTWFSATLQRLLLPNILQKASMIITNSNNTSSDLADCYPFTKDKIFRIYPASDTYYSIKPNEPISAKAHFFLSVGTLEPRKNLNMLLDAYLLFRQKSEYTHKLIICGATGWKNQNFFKKLNNHPFRNDIELKGYVPKEELKELYKTTAAFVYPSLYEGFGFPVAEALNCNATCFVSNTSSLPEVGGDSVFYFNPDSAEELFTLFVAAASESLPAKNKCHNAFTIESFSKELGKAIQSLQ